jgi:hypothetical protein
MPWNEPPGSDGAAPLLFSASRVQRAIPSHLTWLVIFCWGVFYGRIGLFNAELFSRHCFQKSVDVVLCFCINNASFGCRTIKPTHGSGFPYLP